jgi:hypothetical protein
MNNPETHNDSPPKVGKRSRTRGLVAILVAGVLGWIALDLYGPRATDIRRFDPNEVARLDTAMWRSYYDKERLRLFGQLAELLRTQYRMPLLRSHVAAYHAARAAFIFKEGHNRADYEKALPSLVSFYAAIRKISNLPFDVDRAAQLELEWWIVHREEHGHAPDKLIQALAEVPAEIYSVPAERLMEHARLRAEAMTIRDTKATAGHVTEADWEQIGNLLRASYQSLSRAINP